MKSRRAVLFGFTLIELLVVLGIIALLAGLLFPVLAGVRAKGRTTSCLSNERQLGAAILLYAQDYDQHFPPAMADGYRYSTNWYQLLEPLLKSKEAFRCPADPCTWPAHAITPRVSYIYNVFIGGILDNGIPNNVYMTNKTLAEINRPAGTVLLTDGETTAEKDVPPPQWPLKSHFCPDNGTRTLGDATVGGVVQSDAGSPAAPHARHQDKTNALFVDGHVKTLAIEAFFVPPGQRASPTSNIDYSPCLDPERGCL